MGYHRSIERDGSEIRTAEGQRARQLIEANLRLGENRPSLRQAGVELSDLIQEGTIALSRAVDGFEPARDTSSAPMHIARYFVRMSRVRLPSSRKRNGFLLARSSNRLCRFQMKRLLKHNE